MFVECDAWYRDDGPEHLRAVGETEWVVANADPVVEGIVGTGDLRLGARAEEMLHAHVEAGAGRFRGIRQRATWDDPTSARATPTPAPACCSTLRSGTGSRCSTRSGSRSTRGCTSRSCPTWSTSPAAYPEATIVLNHLGAPITLGPYARPRHNARPLARADEPRSPRARTWC